MKKQKSYYKLAVDTELWKKFKSTCAARGKSMLDVITNLIEKYVGEK